MIWALGRWWDHLCLVVDLGFDPKIGTKFAPNFAPMHNEVLKQHFWESKLPQAPYTFALDA
jgi:hypothetical protein